MTGSPILQFQLSLTKIERFLLLVPNYSIHVLRNTICKHSKFNLIRPYPESPVPISVQIVAACAGAGAGMWPPVSVTGTISKSPMPVTGTGTSINFAGADYQHRSKVAGASAGRSQPALKGDGADYRR